jgi:hypothetical protein
MKNAFYHGLKSTDLVLFVVILSMDLLKRILQQILPTTLVHHPHQIHLRNHQDIHGHYQIYSIWGEDRQVDIIVEVQAHLRPLVATVVIILKVGEDIPCRLMKKILIKPPSCFISLFVYAFFSTARFELRIPIGGKHY